MIVSESLETMKWDLGNLVFKKTSNPAAAKKSPDQKEDRFRPMSEILLSYSAPAAKQTFGLNYVFAGLIALSWLIFPALVRHRVL